MTFLFLTRKIKSEMKLGKIRKVELQIWKDLFCESTDIPLPNEKGDHCEGDWSSLCSNRKHSKDRSTKREVRCENRHLIRDILVLCDRGDYKRHNVLLVGQSGSGKSSIVNTIRKAVVGDYRPVARAGGGHFQSNTLYMNWYPYCGATASDFTQTETNDNPRGIPVRKKACNNEPFKATFEKLPHIFDVAGIEDNKVTEETKEILRLLLGGYIPLNTNLIEMEKKQRKFGLGYLPKLFYRAKDEYKISMVLFACPCTGHVPYYLIKCLREVLGESDPITLSRQYDVDVFVLFTKYDEVCPEKLQRTNDTMKNQEDSNDSSGDENVNVITLKQVEKLDKEIAREFNISGMEGYSRMFWVSYNSSVGYDDPYIDNRSLRLLKRLTTPKYSAIPPNDLKDKLQHFSMYLTNMQERIRINIQLKSLSFVVFFVFVCVLVWSFVRYLLEKSHSKANR